MKRWLLTCLVLFFSWGGMRGNVADGDSLIFSLLTCSPGNAVYELYGHTGIRCRSFSGGGDWVFNYGVFDFSEPHFIGRFLRGECDYRIGVAPFDAFCQEYDDRGSSVYEQVLNLTASEKHALLVLLTENLRPENLYYRYNFLYDNCTTRARDMIERAVDGNVVYPTKDTLKSFRQIIHQYTAAYPWAELGNDICLGAEADVKVSEREEMFAPMYMLAYADSAVIVSPDGEVRPFVLSKAEIVRGRTTDEAAALYVTPFAVMTVLLVLVLLLTFLELRYNLKFWWLDIVLMTLQGGIGLVVTFLFFFSVHPTVGSNWQIIVFNPLPLLALPWVVWSAVKGRKNGYHYVAAFVLTFFIIFSLLLPQDFCDVVVPLAFILLTRACSYIYRYHKDLYKKHVQ